MGNFPNRKLVIVVGAHRSGTSLCAAAIEALGAKTGIVDLYKNDENEKGFFEHLDVVEFNEKLLMYLGGSWDNPFFNGVNACREHSLSSWLDSAKDLIIKNFSESNFSVVKDPRFCQLLGFWLEAFKTADYKKDEVFIIHIFRNPVEVAKSQVNRVKTRPEYYELGRMLDEAALLWYSLSLQALLQCQGYQNYFISYSELLSNTKTVLSGIARFLELDTESIQENIAFFDGNFVQGDLRHQVATTVEQELLKSAIPEVFVLDKILADIDAQKYVSSQNVLMVQKLYQQFNDYLPVFAVNAISRLSQLSRLRGIEVKAKSNQIEQLEDKVVTLEKDRDNIRVSLQTELSKLRHAYEAQVKLLNQDKHILKQQLDTQLSEIIHMSNILNEFTGSTSWRITAPLRLLKTRFTELDVGKYWRNFRYFSQRAYITLYRKNPKLSRLLRKTLSPFFYFVDKKLNVRRSYLDESRFSGLNEGHFDETFQQPDLIARDISLKVSIIVPNYNHADFLTERLDSIYGQSYQNFEVILLDDCSTDNSLVILRNFEERFPEKTCLIVNETNSGGVFHQWKKGLQLASGDLVWIAESDDFCSENFLETLVPFFRNEAVSLAYSQTVFVRGQESEPVWSIQEYLSDIDSKRWNSAFVITGHEIVQDAFAVKNIIPNVSSAIFRKLDDFEMFHDPQWMKMRTCGDWILYLHIIRGGMLAYSPDATNYYRLHDTNTSVSSYKDDVFYREHEHVAKTVQRYFKVPETVFIKQKVNLEEHWLRTRTEFSQEQFDACYSLSRISDESSERAINLLMAGYAFSAGGGETFPIMLANLLKGVGYNVTFLDCNQQSRVKEIRRSLRTDIPVVSDVASLPEIVEKFGLDMIHSHHGWVDNTILDLLPEDASCKTLVTLHGFYETVDDEDLEVLLPRLVHRSTRLIYTAEKNLEAIKRFKLVDNEKIERIDNALAIEPFTPIDRTSYGIPESAFLLTLVSRAIDDKGWYEAIEAVIEARRLSGEDIHLILIGEGPVYDKLHAKGLPGYIHLLGFRKNLRDFFAASDMGFLPSRFEGESFPLVIIDCLHAGTPVLASSIGEIPYMLETSKGMAGALFDLNDWTIDVDALAEKISVLVNNRTQLEALRECVPLAAAAFDPQSLAERYDSAYRKSLSQ